LLGSNAIPTARLEAKQKVSLLFPISSPDVIDIRAVRALSEKCGNRVASYPYPREAYGGLNMPNQNLTNDQSCCSAEKAGSLPRILAVRRIGYLLPVVAVFLGLVACDEPEPAFSLTAMAFYEQTVDDHESLAGEWRLEKDTIMFEPAGPSEYRMLRDGEAIPVVVLRAGDVLLLEFTIHADADEGGATYYLDCPIAIDGRDLTVSCLNGKWLGTSTQPYEEIDHIVKVFVGSEAELRELILSGDQQAFVPMLVLHRPDRQRIEELMRLAEAGDPAAQEDLGKELIEGIDAEEDSEAGVAWIERAAGQDRASAQEELGKAFEFGITGERDVAKALYWHEKAAAQGFGPAEYSIAQIYASGSGVGADLYEAARWYERAAMHDVPQANVSLGQIYADGVVVPRDEGKAFMLEWRAVQLNPNLAEGWDALSVLYQTASELARRDESRAISCARRAVALSREEDAAMLDHLASAYSEAGYLELAAAAEKKAVEHSSGKAKEEYESRLARFQ